MRDGPWVVRVDGIDTKTGRHRPRQIGTLQLDRLDRDDVAKWLDSLAMGGELSRRSIQIVRMVLRAVLDDAVEAGLIRRSPARRVPMPRQVSKTAKAAEVKAWDDAQIRRFLAAGADPRWGGPIRLEALFGLRRSELLALRRSDVDLDARRVTIDEGLIAVAGRSVWTGGKNERSRRTIPVR